MALPVLLLKRFWITKRVRRISTRPIITRINVCFLLKEGL
jgi:hypothetical protein